MLVQLDTAVETGLSVFVFLVNPLWEFFSNGIDRW